MKKEGGERRGTPALALTRLPALAFWREAPQPSEWTYLPGALDRWDVNQRSPKRWCAFLNQSLCPRRLEFVVITQPQVRFEQRGPELVAVEIGQRSCSPLIGSVHRALFALGLDISSYRARPDGGGLIEHLVLERHGGGRIEGALSAEAKAAILPIALRGYSGEGRPDTR